MKEMSPFRWEDIDHRLVTLKLLELAEQMRGLIKEAEARIQLDNRGNSNGSTVLSSILKMKLERTEEWARRKYEIYCQVWQTQGYIKSAAFIRAVAARAVLDTFRSRTAQVAAEFSKSARRTNVPFPVRDAMLNHFRLDMQRMEDRWRRRIEIEAKECEHIDRIAKSRLATRAKETGDLGNLSDEDVGKKRAADIVRAQREIAEVRGQMDSDDDYDRLKAKYPTFMLFKICEREPELKLLLLGIKGHHQRRALRFAKQVAASHNGIKLNTIEKAWDKYNPDKKTRPPARRTSLKA